MTRATTGVTFFLSLAKFVFRLTEFLNPKMFSAFHFRFYDIIRRVPVKTSFFGFFVGVCPFQLFPPLNQLFGDFVIV